jgi:FemAB-related protein (PEP-CTERM system-associated)
VSHNSTLTLAALQAADRADWNAYVFAHADGTFFHRAEWQTIIEQAFGHRTFFVLARRAEKICGVLPLGFVTSLLFGKALVSNPFCVYGGILADDDEVRAALHAHASALAKSLGASHLEYRHQQAQLPHLVTQNLYFTFRKEILPEVEANLNAIPRKQRAVVRKGIDAGLQGEIDSNIERFFACYAASVHRLGTPVFSRRYFALLKKIFGDDCEVLTICTPEGEAVSSVLSFYFRDTVLPYYGGGSERARDTRANDFMYWDLLRRACERGLKVFDYGRSKEGTGAFSFKKNWGFEPQPLHYEFDLVNCTEIPQHNPLNPKYQLFIKLWQKLPLPVANFLGPHIVRGLG